MNIDNIYVAKLGKTVGLNGHLKLHVDSDFPEQFKKGSSFLTNKKLNLKIAEYNSNRQTIKFENYNDIEIAKKLINQELFSSPEQTKENCKLDKNEFFWFDLISCEVIEDNILLGVVKDVHRYPISDYLEIDTSESLVAQGQAKTFLLPHLFDQYILNVDIESKKINVIKAYEILENS